MGVHGDPALGYVLLRDARLAENRKRMDALGLLNLSHSLSNSARTNKISTTIKNQQKRLHSPKLALPSVPARRSSRLLGTTLPSHKEVSTTIDHDVRTASDQDFRNRQPEVYTEEDEKLLGHSEEDWELFKDGYGADGTRIYDSINGKTCHQCRQKTLGLRTMCSQCQSLRGQFCGDCLFMRYGENVVEALKNEKWVCPRCRGICNCSFCRIKKGWAPTGSLYRLASSLNFKSVAHYLIATRRTSEENLEVACGETAAHLKDGGTPKAESSTAEDNENEQSEGLALRALIIGTTLNAHPPKEPIVDISDTEQDNSQGSRRKRPRRCKMKSRA